MLSAVTACVSYRGRPGYEIRKAYVRDATKNRNLSVPITLVSTIDAILSDPDIDCVVEVMGGTSLAWDIVRQAILNEKHVITANKALISKYMNELATLLEERPMVHFHYEAAVCGGIPIIATIKRAMTPDRITRIVGIMNGTTNYMLSNMASSGKDYATALREAQREGYAEADPSADVLGWDARSKLCILAKLAFGLTLDEATVPCMGITQIEETDFEYAKMLNRTIKLLGLAEAVPSDPKNHPEKLDQIAVSVCPVMVPLDNPLAHISGATNAVALESDNLGSSLLIGPGAGRFPTANSVVADIVELRQALVRAACHDAPAPFAEPQWNRLTAALDYEADFYIRLIINDQVGVIHSISGVLAKHGIPIFSILQTPIKDYRRVPFVVITEKCKLSAINAMREEIQKRRSTDLTFVLEEPLCLRYFASN